MQDERIETIAEVLISRLLRTGVAVSAVLVIAGTALVFIHHPSYRHSRTELAGLTSTRTEYPRTVRDVYDGVRSGKGQGIAMVGLLLLIATPVLRVAASIVLFAIEKDGTYVAITSTVLALLILSFVIGAGG